MKNISASGFIFFNILFISLFFFSCRGISGVKSLDYRVGKNIDLSERELVNLPLKLDIDPRSRFRVVVTVFRYSSGPEVLSYSGGEKMNAVSRGGEVEALVQIVEGKRIKIAEFVRASGVSREELLAGLTREVNKILRD